MSFSLHNLKQKHIFLFRFFALTCFIYSCAGPVDDQTIRIAAPTNRIPPPTPTPKVPPTPLRQMQLVDTVAPTKDGTRQVTVADVDGDGNLDLLINEFMAGQIDIWYGKGGGKFEFPVSLPITEGKTSPFYNRLGPDDVQAVDIDGDGLLDLVFHTFDNQQIQIWLNKNESMYQNRTYTMSTISLPGRPYSLSNGDFNKDGKIDLVVYREDTFYSGDGKVMVFFGKGDGTFEIPVELPFSTSLVKWLYQVKAVDINGDGHTDVVGVDNQNIAVWLGDSTGIFQPMKFYADSCVGGTFQLGDMNGDGKLDILGGGIGKGCILLQQNDGSFLQDTSLLFPSQQFWNANWADLNGDGYLDLFGTSTVEQGDDYVTKLFVFSGDSKGNFSSSLTLPSSSYPSRFEGGLISADINQDGFQDMISANDERGLVEIYSGDGHGAFQHLFPQSAAATKPIQILSGKDHTVVVDAQTQKLISDWIDYEGNYFEGSRWWRYELQGTQLSAMAMGDLNNDGHDEVVVVDQAIQKMRILKNVPGRDIQERWLEEASTSWDTGPMPSFVAIADWNGDGKNDILVTESSGFFNSHVRIYINNGDFSFALPVVRSIPEPVGLVAADMNGDGSVDVLVPSTSGTIQILFSNGKGGVANQLSIPGAESIKSIAVEDVNQDNQLDIVIADADHHVLNLVKNLSYLSPAGAFTAPTTIANIESPHTVQIGDFNNDGWQDIAVTDTSNNQVLLLHGDGQGAFIQGQSILVGEGPTVLSKAFINKDTTPDLVLINSLSRTVSSIISMDIKN